ncbi:MAG: PIG-L family deacetylase [Acidimicrobiales bacterium]
MATLVCFHAHPDDEAIATGGTMLEAARAGHRVVLVLATRGEQGEPVEGVLGPDEELWTRRVQESYESARILGASRVEFLGYEDSGMMGEPSNNNPRCFWQAGLDEAAARLAAILREEQADVLTVYDPNGGYGHPDHIQVHRVGLAAGTLAGTSRVYWSTMNRDRIQALMDESPEIVESLEEERAETASAEEFGTPEEQITHAVDVRGVLAEKRLAMAAHASQISADDFFLSLSDSAFEAAFGTEWYVDPTQPRSGRGFALSILDH